MRKLKFSRFRFAGAGKGSRFITEKLALQKISGKSRAIHLHHGPVSADGHFVDQARQNFFAHAALAQKKHGHIDLGNERRPARESASWPDSPPGKRDFRQGID